MDPGPITSADWNQIFPAIMSIFAFLFFIVNFAAAMLLGHAIVPSLVGTGHIPQFMESTRFYLYAGAAGALVIAIGFFALAINFAQVVGNFWPRWLI